jgi:NitT/TauT family transport system substrate-binding protein
VLLVAVWLLPSCLAAGSGPPVAVSVGTTTSEANALIFIAQDQGYFAEHGLQVTHTLYPSGVAALDGLFGGQVELATGSEFAFVGRVLDGQQIRALAAINRSSIEYLVARVDRGIRTLADLPGKTVGVPLKSRPEFALDRYLYLRGIDTAGITRVDVPVDQSVDALVGGRVDAVAAWQPYIHEIRAQMGDRVVAWSVQDDQPSYTLLMAGAGWTAAHSDTAARFLAALAQAEQYLSDHPDAVRAALAARLDRDPGYMAAVWPDYDFGLVLDQALIVAMEDQARWMIANGLTGARQPPNLMPYIDSTGLEAAKPGAVSLIR